MDVDAPVSKHLALGPIIRFPNPKGARARKVQRPTALCGRFPSVLGMLLPRSPSGDMVAILSSPETHDPPEVAQVPLSLECCCIPLPCTSSSIAYFSQPLVLDM